MEQRRRFLAQVASAGAALVLGPGPGCACKQKKSRGKPASPANPPRDEAYGLDRPSGSRARVVVVHAPGVVVKGHQADRARVKRMLEQGLRKLAGTRDARAALSRWFRPVDAVGLKVNCLAGRMMSTHVELVEELVGLLAATGMPRNQAYVFDRADRDLRRGGFPVRLTGKDYRSVGNDRAGYEQQLRVMPSGASRFSNVATKVVSGLINLPILKDHGLAGISGALKNNFGLVHNPNKFHLNGCDPHVAEVNSWKFVHEKQRLVICDALRVQVEGGPAYHAAGAQTHERLLLATDPVALDMVAWRMLEGLRKARKLPTLKRDRREPKHILTAGKQGLGVADRGKIERIEVEVS